MSTFSETAASPSKGPRPSPPGRALDLSRALVRENRLTPEEQTARDSVMVLVPRPPALTPGERVAPFVPLLQAQGWRTEITDHALRARLEAFHPCGAVIMITADTRRRASTGLYVLRPTEGNWRKIHTSTLTHFARTLTLPPEGRFPIVPSKCRCLKASFPTGATAAARLAEIAATAAPDTARPVRHYRCDADDRVWHLTSKPTGYTPATPLTDAYHPNGVPQRRPRNTK
ncbi:hypothetical protein AB0J01_38000 [Streptomyces sp. NPDC050204]|uniref:hypothetical protein n=1 Tax=Streptomyces sp. NPDC050204 TaxID=3155514 RepID=UPI00343B2B22